MSILQAKSKIQQEIHEPRAQQDKYKGWEPKTSSRYLGRVSHKENINAKIQEIHG